MDNEPKRHMRVWRISIVAGVVSCALVVLFLFYETISGNASEKFTMESTLGLGGFLALLFLLIVSMVTFLYFFIKAFPWFAWPTQYLLTKSSNTTHLDVKDLHGLAASSLLIFVVVYGSTFFE